MSGAVTPEPTAVCETVAPEVTLVRSIAILRPDPASGPLDTIWPLFSIEVSVPLRSMIAMAVPSLPPAVALMVPLLRMRGRSAPLSIAIAVVSAPLALPPTAVMLPALRNSPVEASAPNRRAVASASFDVAAMLPVTPMPLAIETAPPRPPMTMPLPSIPA